MGNNPQNGLDLSNNVCWIKYLFGAEIQTMHSNVKNIPETLRV